MSRCSAAKRGGVLEVTHVNPAARREEVLIATFLCFSNDGTEFAGSIYQKVNSNLETAVHLAWTAGSNNTRFGIGAKYQLDKDASLSVSNQPEQRLQCILLLQYSMYSICNKLKSVRLCSARGKVL